MEKLLLYSKIIVPKTECSGLPQETSLDFIAQSGLGPLEVVDSKTLRFERCECRRNV
jgi:hypothetical protein